MDKYIFIKESELKTYIMNHLKYTALTYHNVQKEYPYYYDALDDFAVDWGAEDYQDESYKELANEVIEDIRRENARTM